MANVTRKVHYSIAPIVRTALESGFTVLSGAGTPHIGDTVAFITLPGLPGTMTVQRPTHVWEGAQLIAPVTPNKIYGSGVSVDFDGTPRDAIRAIRAVLHAGVITPRFIGDHPPVPTDNRTPGYLSPLHGVL